MKNNEVLTAYVGAFIDELTRSGIQKVVISPGSRSAPMAMILAEHPDIKVWLHVDERSAGFFALGIAKAHKEPVALLCTSGTAAANYFPAIVEAYEARVPLLVLTADRPHELRGVGAAQAINQIDLFGKYVKWFNEMALPDSTPDMLTYVRTVAGRAVSAATGVSSGPVHLNFPFRDPLIPNLTDQNLFLGGRDDKKMFVRVTNGRAELHNTEIEKLASELKQFERGLIVCGPQDDDNISESITELAEKLRFPILADPLSQLRSGSHDQRWIVDSFDAILKNENVKHTYAPDVIIRFGAMPVSKSYLMYIKHHPECRQLIVDPGVGWREPTLLASEMIYADPVSFCDKLSQQLRNINRPTSWSEQWLEMNEIARDTLRKHDFSNLFEGDVFPKLLDVLPEHSTLFVGNSMPVRDLDTFFFNNTLHVKTMANRGANGIDGVVSSALGASTADQPLVLVIGDLSFYHDLNGLLAAKLHQLNVTIIVINNDGGGIFSFLPQASHPKHFESLFGTPIGLDYEKVVEMYGGTFSRIDHWDTFQDQVKESMQSIGLTVIEVPTDRQTNTAMHRTLWKTVSTSLDNLLEENR